jgi:heme oxygenase (mycobilin-producing)
VLVMTRFTVPVQESEAFAEQAGAALDALAASPGYLRGWLGRAADDPVRWALVTEWAGVGAYRRALSRYQVKVAATPLMAAAMDEPAAFEVLAEAPPGGPVAVHRTSRTEDAAAAADHPDG